MRRGLSSLIFGVSLALASLAGAASAFGATVLDPDTSEQVADRVLASAAIRDGLANEATTGLVHLVTPDQFTRSDPLDVAVETLMARPELTVRLRDRFASAHQLGLQGEQEEPFLDDRELRQVARSVLTETLPDVELKTPSARRFDMQLPIEGYSILSHLRGPVRWTGLVSAVVAAIGFVLSLSLARDRADTCRAGARWAFGAGAAWLGIGMLFRLAAGSATPVPFQAVGATLAAGFTSTLVPATAVAAVGLGLLVFGNLWPVYNSHRGAAALARAAV